MKRSVRIIVFAGALALMSPPSPVAAGGLVGLPAWDRVATPDGGKGDNQLYGVDALAADDVWAVGYSTDGLHDDPLVEHFDGQSWSIVPTPDVSDDQFGSSLLAVDAVSPTDVWAVGGYNDTGDSLIMHWDGSQWAIVAHPNPGTYQRLYAVAAAAADDVWAVGEIADGGVSQTHVLHYDGSTWSVVPSPNGRTGGYNQLLGLTVVSAADVWAVGADGTHALALHWNGRAWSVVNTPAPHGTTYSLVAVSAVAAGDVWAVGDGGSKALTMHWNGTAWSMVPAPSGAAIEDFASVTAIAGDDVWAVGQDGNTLAADWDGVAWSVVPTVDVGNPNSLRGVAAVGPDDVVAVGEGDFATLVERWNGATFAIEASADRGTGFNQLFDVHTGGPDDVWAVGTVDGETLTQHWDGTSFSIVPSPSVAGRDNILEGVDGIATDDVWAVGHDDDPDFIGSRTVTLHWDGTEWSTVPSPSRGTTTDRNNLRAVAAVGPNDVWAVGEFVTASSSQALILRWDGTRWRNVRNTCGASLEGITAFSPTDIWAIGELTSCHWDGSTWTPTPVAPSSDGRSVVSLVDLAGVATDDLWAVGTKATQCGEGGVCFSGAIQHWDGETWTDLAVAPPPLSGVVALAAGDIWAVGSSNPAAIWHRDGTAWSAAPAPDLPAGAAELHAVEGTSSNAVWAVGTLRTGTLSGSSLVLHARAFGSGAVVGDTNVANATVSWIGPETGSVATDPFGDYRVGGLTTGRYTFIATAPGCDPAARTVRVQTGTTIAANITMAC